MWLLHLLPDSLILYITYAMLAIGFAGIILGFFLGKIPLVSQYKLPIQIVSIILFCSGLYWYGGYSTEMALARVTIKIIARARPNINKP